MNNKKIEVTFGQQILVVRFLDGAFIEEKDLREIYEYGNQKANGKPYGILFEAVNHYSVAEDAIEFIANNPYSKDIIAKAYIIDTKEAELKAKAHLSFDHPSLKPFTFKTIEEGCAWLFSKLKEGNS